MSTTPVRSFLIQTDGTLKEAAGSPLSLPNPMPNNAYALGLAAHPNGQVLYVGFVMRNELGVYTYDASGKLTYKTAATDSGKSICWLVMNHDGRTRARPSRRPSTRPGRCSTS
jgi:6-phosphogluconolactonase (cycloisomerase 2 family)